MSATRLACVLLALAAALPVSAQTVKILGRKTTPCPLAFQEVVSNVADFVGGTTGTTVVSPSITLASGNGAFVLITVERSVVAECDGAGDITVADSGAVNTYDLVLIDDDVGNGDQCVAVFYSGLTSTGAVTVTATFSSADNFRAIAVAEYSGVLSGNYTTANDATAVSATASTAGWATPTISTSETQSLLIGFGVTVGGTATSHSPTAPGVERLDVPPFAIVDELCSQDSTVEGTFTGASRTVAVGAAIKRAP